MHLAAGAERYYTQGNKSGGRAEPTKGDQQSGPRMSNILKPIDLTERAIRRAVFAVLDGCDQVRFGALCGLRQTSPDKCQ